MNPVTALLVIVGLVAVATVVGVIWRRRNGRLTTIDPDASARVTPADVGAAAFGSRATLLQFSTEVCAYCPATRVLLGRLAAGRAGVKHVDVDLTHDPDTANRFSILQTPTTLLLDADGTVRARIGGPPRASELEAELDHLLGGTRVAS